MDRRNRKTKQLIRDVFIDLLERKKLKQITVSEIISIADISRGTFYLHYRDVYDLYDKLEDDLYTELEKLYDAFPPKDQKNLIFLTDALIQYIEENKRIFILMLRPEANGNFPQKLRSFFSTKLLHLDPNENNLGYVSVESIFFVAGVIGVIEEWIIGGIKKPPIILSSILQDVLLRLYRQ